MLFTDVTFQSLFLYLLLTHVHLPYISPVFIDIYIIYGYVTVIVILSQEISYPVRARVFHRTAGFRLREAYRVCA